MYILLKQRHVRMYGSMSSIIKKTKQNTLKLFWSKTRYATFFIGQRQDKLPKTPASCKYYSSLHIYKQLNYQHLKTTSQTNNNNQNQSEKVAKFTKHEVRRSSMYHVCDSPCVGFNSDQSSLGRQSGMQPTRSYTMYTIRINRKSTVC